MKTIWILYIEPKYIIYQYRFYYLQKNTMKNHLSIIVLVAAILLFAGCGKPTTNIENDSINNNKEEIISSEIEECKNACVIMSSDNEAKESCYILCETSQKLDSNDINDCDNIEKISKGLMTRDICIQDKASKMENPDLCEKIENSMNKDACYMELASKLNDKSLCNKIKDSMIKNMCEEE